MANRNRSQDNDKTDNDETAPAGRTGPVIRELSVGSLVAGAITGFVIALLRPRRWR